MAGIRVPITNVYGGGDYTAAILVGSRKTPVNVILDTGSSTLAVKQSKYQPDRDSGRKSTALAQDVLYGTGGWAGPVLTTAVAIGGARGGSAGLANGAVALTLDQEPHNFGPADGILGLAYSSLNESFDLTAYLSSRGAKPLTYPWPFPPRDTQSAIEQMLKIFQGMPKKALAPFFTQLVDAKKTANKFAFYTKRSSPKAGGAKDPANQGFFILGGGEEQTDLFQGKFVDVDVVHDAWYNTTLKSIRVGNGAPIRAQPVPAQYKKIMFSNSIVDSGTNSLALSTDMFEAVMAALQKLNPAFAQLAQQASQSRNGVANSSVNLARWPNITLVLVGDKGQDVPLTCTPQTYWQLDAPAKGRASFQINPMGQVQSILGLPLFNNYYTVFDRSVDKHGVIRFAPIK